MTLTTDCSSCEDELASGATFCEVCGRRLAEPPVPEVAAEAPTAARKDCMRCGAAGSVGDDGYCEECGMMAGRSRDHLEADGGVSGAAVSDRGRRHHRNEDAMWLAVGEDAADVVVSDGVSASFDPDAASDIAVRAAGELLAGARHPDVPFVAENPDETVDLEGLERPPGAVGLAGAVAHAITGAAAAVASLAHTGDPRRAAANPACTIVAAAVRGPHVGYGWVGDSRVYWLGPEGPAEQLTEDDSWATHVIAMGADPVSAMNDPKAHAITAWLGADAGPVRPRVRSFTATEPGHLLLCSDGLWNYLVDPGEFGDLVRECLKSANSLLGAARAMVAYANAAGGADNITVAVIPVRPAVTEPEPETTDLDTTNA
ncbi:PP2C family serine/threonine-protein phosphatase [Actinoplanes sp. NPDC026670]|uniref:PP2C family protein-serine/threonine phosphatase n=1 Tax=Actinoplanes sp. NPDC026670 TaxID=3154700 RepID=UPI0033FB2CD0